MLTKISVTLFAGGIVFRTLMGVDFWTGALITVGFTGVYTVFGGLRALEAETKGSRRIDLWLSIGVAALVAFVWIPFA